LSVRASFSFSELLPNPAGISRVAPERTSPVLKPLDIFVKMESGTYLWKGTAETFELAKTKVKQLVTAAPGDYLIFSQTTGKKTIIPLDAT
jgi:hypothetical protein